MPYRTPGISIYSNLCCGNAFAETTRASRTCIDVLRASISPEIALLLFNKSGHGNVWGQWMIGSLGFGGKSRMTVAHTAIAGTDHHR
jgi:hypothetical protein